MRSAALRDCPSAARRCLRSPVTRRALLLAAVALAAIVVTYLAGVRPPALSIMAFAGGLFAGPLLRAPAPPAGLGDRLHAVAILMFAATGWASWTGSLGNLAVPVIGVPGAVTVVTCLLGVGCFAAGLAATAATPWGHGTWAGVEGR